MVFLSYLFPLFHYTMASRPNTFQSMGLAGFTALTAVNFTHPIDTVKTRLQVGDFSLRSMIRSEGVTSLYKGIQAAWLREASYTSIKLGGYGPIRNLLGASNPDAPLFLKFAAGAASGSIGSIVGNPFDVMKTMMMTNSKEKVPLSNLARKMLLEQGPVGFYRGVQANIARACVLNGTKMSCYDSIKGAVVRTMGWERTDLRCQFFSAFGAGFFMTCTVAPFDMVRTTLMNQPSNKQLYKGFVDCAGKIMVEQGPRGFYRGFLPIWGRFAPVTTLQLVIFEALLRVTGFDPI